MVNGPLPTTKDALVKECAAEGKPSREQSVPGLGIARNAGIGHVRSNFR
jgi:hypothetical protein